ncbi:MAG: bifunctional UDP-N-acetylglucosamine diphosphorylase/glucosamine-1-phosphate N-acetyltransferase GlmU [Acidobacteriota bacterium]
MSGEAGRLLAAALVLAAGLGKRMRSGTIKLLHPVWGRPMVAWVLDAVAALPPARLLVVLGHQAPQMRAALSAYEFQEVPQESQRGTGHAVLCARELLANHRGDLLILNGDLPLLTGAVLRRFHARHTRSGAVLSLLTTIPGDATGYGRVLRTGERVHRIVEERDASPEEKRIQEINCGIYLASIPPLLEALDRLTTDNAQGEYYLTDVVEALATAGHRVQGVLHPESREVLGVNDRKELAEAVALLGRQKNNQLMTAGVSIVDPAHTYIDPRAAIGCDTVVYPDVWIEGASSIGERCVIRPHVRLTRVQVGHDVLIKDSCVVQDSEIGPAAQIGPFAHLRPGSRLAERVKVGNFVETKKAILGPGTKASHLSYLGDAALGANVNVGAGTITCNFDGTHKHRTTLEDGVFIGSDTQLVAPVRVGAGAYVGAGTTVTEDVPPGSLALSRVAQRHIKGWVARKKARASKPKGGG